MSWKPRVATVDMVDSCTAIPQFFARRLRRPSLFCLYNPPLLESIYHYISTMDLWIPVASHQMASPSLPIVSLQRCENEQLQSSKPETNRDLKGGNNSPVKQQVHCSQGRDNTTRTDTAGLCNSAAWDGWGYLPNLANVNTPQTHAFAKSSQIRWKKSPLWAALSGWRLAIFCNSESILPGRRNRRHWKPPTKWQSDPLWSTRIRSRQPWQYTILRIENGCARTPGTPELQKSIAFKEITKKSPGFWVQSPSSPRSLGSTQLKD